MGPFRVISNAGDRPARERLTEMEQTRHVLAGMLGKTDLQTVWPIVLVLFPNQKKLIPLHVFQRMNSLHGGFWRSSCSTRYSPASGLA